jgi:hypothetical protein
MSIRECIRFSSRRGISKRAVLVIILVARRVLIERIIGIGRV